jgi:hypothetical protein
MCGTPARIDQTRIRKEYTTEYAALTETVDIEADWIRLKHHPQQIFVQRRRSGNGCEE